ncbi:LOW QUALITY PROTEIN: hypothetical protein PHMEG_00011355 [Phytophthora megakarya]|uniref:ISXO2-like transposase domain-containing protein n=1 Tax=Phytophthora megakarya TaxID=4795 RepID=A0A225WDY3_9STRA|nr:LOW QUALITY PROTEIN: hypothetical protein PHMEG_00011355 [Phytophthora megakarya]
MAPEAPEYDLSVDSVHFTFNTVMLACATEEGALKWCMRDGLIAESMACPKCLSEMRRQGKRWRCNRSGCRLQRSAHAKSFFARSKAPLSKLVKVLYFWASRTHVGEAAQHVELTPTAAGQWYMYARDICSAEMNLCDMRVGGEGHVVEIDETSMKKKQKYHRHPDFWVFGGVDRTTKKWFARVVYEDRTKPTLPKCIKECIKPGTLIMSDMFKSYVTEVQSGPNKGLLHTLENNRHLAGMGYIHQPLVRCPYQPDRGIWEVKIKARLKSERGIRKSVVPQYLDECLWRSWYFKQTKKPQASQYFHGLVLGIQRKYQL